MKKKSLVSMLIALSLVAVIMIGATLAYLTDTTDNVVNTFTIGKVDITLTEPSWDPEDAENLEPGAEIAKDPVVTNTGKNDAYVAVTVTGMEEMAKVGFEAVVNDGWVLVDANGTPVAGWDGKLVDGIYAYTAGVLAPSEVSGSLFDKVVFTDNGTYDSNYVINEVAVDEKDESKGTYFVIEGVEGQFATEAEARAYIDSLQNELTYSFDLVLKAYAIQTTGFEIATDGVYTWVAEFGL